ncbi:MAG: pseudouridine synthase [Cellvibrionaceae bacterium]|nr:pseudouridine synthase [Cellvibrionaceae bacterium]
MSYIEIIYQDQDMLVVNKPSGLLSVPGRGPDKQDCLINRLLPEFPNARIVHRLDMATSGLLLVALNHPAQVGLGRQFEQRQVEKHYTARVAGRPAEAEGLVDLPLICDWARRPIQVVDHQAGKPALTRYQCRAYLAELDATEVDLYPLTGRSHQLRVHMQALGHPILGDNFYAPTAIQAQSPRLCLHATRIQCQHPVSGTAVSWYSEANF